MNIITKGDQYKRGGISVPDLIWEKVNETSVREVRRYLDTFALGRPSFGAVF